MLAAKNRELALILRKLEDIPTRTELIQFEKRFVELYSTMAAKSEETKKLYNTYNTLVDCKTYLTKEASIVNSLAENFAQLKDKKGASDKLVQGVEDIVTSVKSNLERVEV